MQAPLLNMKSNKRILNILFIVLTFLSIKTLYAQSKTISIIGAVIEEGTQHPLEFVTVLIADNNTKKPISGTTTLENGRFSFQTNATNFYIEISFMGFTTKTFEKYNIINGIIDLEKIYLSENAQALDEVVVQGEVSKTVFKLDKRIFNVGKDISSTGASALEVLNNVPSVNVSIEGEITLRGSSGVQILINGKPTVMESALATLTADIIEKIEVITSPSAKYDAEGTAGIINIVLKTEEKEGINGSITLNIGIPNNHSLGFSLNKRTDKFNVFSQLGVGHRTFPEQNELESHDFENNTTIKSTGEDDFNETYVTAILGADYHINEHNVLTVSGRYAHEWESQNSNAVFNLFDAPNTLTDSYNRTEFTTAKNPKYQYELQYQKNFKNNKEQILLFSAIGDFFSKDQESEFNNTTTFGNQENIKQKSRTDFTQANYNFKLDYTHPFLDKFTIETGLKYGIDMVTNDYANENLIDNDWVVNLDQTNIMDFSQNILALYATSAYQGEKWGLKLGLRLENTDLETLLKNTNEYNKQKYINFFPSGHTSYKVSDLFSLQLGYSKRVSRPSLWDLNPFYNIRSSISITTGNPNLQPEYTDSFEITSIHKLGKLSINWAVFNRYTTNYIEEIVSYQDNVSITKPENVGDNNTLGLEANIKYRPFKWMTLDSEFIYTSFKRNGSFDAVSFDFKGDNNFWGLTGQFKLPAKIDLEIKGIYRGAYKTLQQEVVSNLYANFGLRKKILKGKVVLNLSIRDLFESRHTESITDQSDFYLQSDFRRGRFVTFGVSYGFGKGEAMEFSGQKMF